MDKNYFEKHQEWGLLGQLLLIDNLSNMQSKEKEAERR